MLIRIYALIDPETEQPFYVGRTQGSLKNRLSGHIHNRGAVSNQKSAKIQSLLAKGLYPQINLIEEKYCLSFAEMAALEQTWIDRMAQTFSLSNKGKATNGLFAGLPKKQVEHPGDSIEISIELSPKHLKALTLWAAFHGRTSSDFASQIIGETVDQLIQSGWTGEETY